MVTLGVVGDTWSEVTDGLSSRRPGGARDVDEQLGGLTGFPGGFGGLTGGPPAAFRPAAECRAVARDRHRPRAGRFVPGFVADAVAEERVVPA